MGVVTFSRRDFLKGSAIAGVIGLIGLPTIPLLESSMQFKLGKNAPNASAPQVHLDRYLNYNNLPEPPAEFGHESLIPNWLMLGNDRVGDCAVAGPFHA